MERGWGKGFRFGVGGSEGVSGNGSVFERHTRTENILK